MRLAIFLNIGSSFEVLLWIFAVVLIVYVLAKKKSALNKDKNIPFDDSIVEDALELEEVLEKKSEEKLEEVVEDVQVEKSVPEKEISEEVPEKAPVIEKKNKPDLELNWDRIGASDFKSKDNLKKIKGIGPVLERKLNEIGITSFSQIENLNKNDLQLVSVLTNYPFSKIHDSHWAKQVKEMQ